MSAIENITNELQTLGSTEKAAHLSRFFKTGKGQYGENDRFLGVTVPQTRRVAMAHAGVNLADLQLLFKQHATHQQLGPRGPFRVENHRHLFARQTAQLALSASRKPFVVG